MIDIKQFNVALAKAGKTKAEFAQYLGINRSTLHKKLNGQSDFSHAELKKAEELFGQEELLAIFFAQ